ncbi:MAG TPA: hypothetical protein IGS52_22615 [Oscillatoriaceae cyanobacterium M33_DOE_052]|uniref:Uncharacterized protein n=1 Tax=Planktothricoides sp. SpSt-374 TaxID=2282167 RepID=A0A7C3VSX5_9CYAN|nr:hypothetical protein [Oscillatoriaceae cyanobacterium M33_DOE_052]
MSVSTPSGGNITIESGANPSPKELQSASYYTEQGLNVKFLNPDNTPNVRTPDILVDGIGNVDLYHPTNTTSVEAIIRAIKKKGSQTPTVHVELPADTAISDAEAQHIPARVFGGIGGSGIQRIIITKSCQLIVDRER